MERTKLIDRADARKAIFMAKTVEHNDRRLILEMLLASPEGRTVTNIYTDVTFRNRPSKEGGELDQSVCSQHLAWLRKHGFVSTQRDGKNIIYTANTDHIRAAETAIIALAALMPEETAKAA